MKLVFFLYVCIFVVAQRRPGYPGGRRCLLYIPDLAFGFIIKCAHDVVLFFLFSDVLCLFFI
jgi:hypothetical protein